MNDEDLNGAAGAGDEPGTGGGPRCPACESELYARHCKYVCPQHGVIYDCSDPFY